jgi:hypothetical protein
MAADVVMTFPFSECELLVTRFEDRRAQTRDLLAHPHFDQFRQHLLDQCRVVAKAARNCRICCRRVFLS